LVRPVRNLKQLRYEDVVGKPTYEMFERCKQHGKDIYVWDAETGGFYPVQALTRMPGDSYKQWGRLVCSVGGE
jgi:hypothetical protein